MTDLFSEIDTFLERMRARQREVAAMQRHEWEQELWSSIRPFLRTVDDYRAAAGFMAAMLRGRDRGE